MNAPQTADLRAEMTYFVHIPKTAGTSIRRIIRKVYSDEQIAFVYLPPQGSSIHDILKLPPERRQRLRAIYGHFPYGIHNHLGTPGRYFTFFRHPRERIISNFFHHIREGLTSGLELYEYFQRVQPKDMDNYAVRLLSGADQGVKFGGMTEKHLRLAQDNLEQRFTVFGLVEKMEESVQRLCAALGIQPVSVERENAAPSTHVRRVIPSGDIGRLVDQNEFDVALYQFAEQLFERKM